MRHRLSGRHLGRNPSHRNSLKRNLALAILSTYGSATENSMPGRVRICTTLEKAKEVKSFIERLVTVAVRSRKMLVVSDNLLASRPSDAASLHGWKISEQGIMWQKARSAFLAGCRRLFDVLRNWDLVRLLVDRFAVVYQHRNGGYLRVVRIAKQRIGDAATMAYLEFVGSDQGITAPLATG